MMAKNEIKAMALRLKELRTASYAAKKAVDEINRQLLKAMGRKAKLVVDDVMIRVRPVHVPERVMRAHDYKVVEVIK